MRTLRLLQTAFFVLLFSGSSLAQPADQLATRLIDSAVRLEAVQPRAAIALYQQTIALSTSQRYLPGLAQAQHYLGFVYTQQGQYDSSLYCLKNAAAIYEKIGNNWGVGVCLNNIAHAFRHITQYDSSLYYYQRALDVYNLYHLEAEKRLLYLGRGKVHQSLKAYTEALEDFVQAEKLSITYNDSMTFARALIHEGTVYRDLGAADENYKRQIQALQIGQRIGDDLIMQTAAANLSEYHEHKQMFDTALSYANLAFEKAISLNDPAEGIRIKSIIAGIYAGKGQHKKARQLLFEALQLADRTHSLENQALILQKLHKSYAATGEYVQAYEYQSRHQKTSDSLLNTEHVRAIREMETRYQTAQKDAAIIKNKLDMQLKDNLLILILAASGIIILQLILLIVRNRYRSKQQKYQLEILQKNNELRLLQSLMEGEEKERTRIARELHDGLSGMLSAAKMHLSTHKQNPAATAELHKAMELMDEAANEVRKTAHNLLPEILHKYGLIKALEKYCNAVSSPHASKVSFYTLGNIQPLQANFELGIYRIAQELIHNAVRHASAKNILVQLSQVEGLLSLSVEDDGTGFIWSEYKGAGLFTIQQRVRLLSGTINWDSTPGNGTSVYAEFDISNMLAKSETEHSFYLEQNT